MHEEFRLINRKIRDLTSVTPPKNARAFIIEKCSHLRSLDGIIVPEGVSQLTIRECPLLENLDALVPLCDGTFTVNLEDCPALPIIPPTIAAHMPASPSLILSGMNGLQDLSFLVNHSQTTRVKVKGNDSIESLVQAMPGPGAPYSRIQKLHFQGSRLRNARGIPFGAFNFLEVESPLFSDFSGLSAYNRLATLKVTTEVTEPYVPEPREEVQGSIYNLEIRWNPPKGEQFLQRPFAMWLSGLHRYIPRAEILVHIDVPRNLSFDMSWLNRPGMEWVSVCVAATGSEDSVPTGEDFDMDEVGGIDDDDISDEEREAMGEAW